MMIKSIEHACRPYLYAVMAFAALYSMTYQWLNSGSIFIALATYSVFATVSIQVGKGMHRQMDEFFYSFDWDENCIIVEYRIMKRVIQGIGVVLLYFYVQAGIVLFIEPGLFSVKRFGVPIIWPFIAANCYLVTSFYRQFIWEPFEPLEDDDGEEFMENHY
ncbi:hypothetical protein LCM10_04745 [Rossellomorea aquimaris]|uniref:hypothetical protein n=1 Tax=Rossellomorea aquimaris TaxID=189382 RepID=UPI001CD1C9F6|nr:hypothetical protein [Rossellomorea aquimaris]MCA1054287.1 hypothetical protein [Rossellomorea aquimaris]